MALLLLSPRSKTATKTKTTTAQTAEHPRCHYSEQRLKRRHKQQQQQQQQKGRRSQVERVCASPLDEIFVGTANSSMICNGNSNPEATNTRTTTTTTVLSTSTAVSTSPSLSLTDAGVISLSSHGDSQSRWMQQRQRHSRRKRRRTRRTGRHSRWRGISSLLFTTVQTPFSSPHTTESSLGRTYLALCWIVVIGMSCIATRGGRMCGVWASTSFSSSYSSSSSSPSLSGAIALVKQIPVKVKNKGVNMNHDSDVGLYGIDGALLEPYSPRKRHSGILLRQSGHTRHEQGFNTKQHIMEGYNQLISTRPRTDSYVMFANEQGISGGTRWLFGKQRIKTLIKTTHLSSSMTFVARHKPPCEGLIQMFRQKAKICTLTCDHNVGFLFCQSSRHVLNERAETRRIKKWVSNTNNNDCRVSHTPPSFAYRTPLPSSLCWTSSLPLPPHTTHVTTRLSSSASSSSYEGNESPMNDDKRNQRKNGKTNPHRRIPNIADSKKMNLKNNASPSSSSSSSIKRHHHDDDDDNDKDQHHLVHDTSDKSQDTIFQTKKNDNNNKNGGSGSNVHPSIPYHVALICDGNSRWAEHHHLPAKAGHARGANRIISTVQQLHRAGVRVCTMYGFSTENWSRPQNEIDDILQIMEHTANTFYETAVREEGENNNVCVEFLGDLNDERLPLNLREALIRLERDTAKKKKKKMTTTTRMMMKEESTRTTSSSHRNDETMTVCIAINYGGRADILNACAKLVTDVVVQSQQQSGEKDDVAPIRFDEETFASYLSTSSIPDPDLIIRTGGERRLSNFLLWNAAYAELYFTDVLWPDFDEKCLDDALRWYGGRSRRFGGRRGKGDRKEVKKVGSGMEGAVNRSER